MVKSYNRASRTRCGRSKGQWRSRGFLQRKEKEKKLALLLKKNESERLRLLNSKEEMNVLIKNSKKKVGKKRKIKKDTPLSTQSDPVSLAEKKSSKPSDPVSLAENTSKQSDPVSLAEKKSSKPSDPVSLPNIAEGLSKEKPSPNADTLSSTQSHSPDLAVLKSPLNPHKVV